MVVNKTRTRLHEELALMECLSPLCSLEGSVAFFLHILGNLLDLSLRNEVIASDIASETKWFLILFGTGKHADSTFALEQFFILKWIYNWINETLLLLLFLLWIAFILRVTILHERAYPSSYITEQLLALNLSQLNKRS